MKQSVLTLLILLMLLAQQSHCLVSNGKIFVQGGDEFHQLCKSFDKKFIDSCGGSNNAKIGIISIIIIIIITIIIV